MYSCVRIYKVHEQSLIENITVHKRKKERKKDKKKEKEKEKKKKQRKKKDRRKKEDIRTCTLQH